MAFELVGPLFDKVDTVAGAFVTDVSSNAIATVTPIISVSLTLSFIMFGILIMTGTIEMPVMDFIRRSARVAFITGIALGGGLYQTDIAAVVYALPDDMASALMESPTTGSAAANIIDNAATKGFDQAAKAFEQGGFLSADGLVFYLFGLIIILATAALVAIGAAFMLLAKLAIAVLVGLGPIFIVALLFQPTARFFEMWVGQVVNYVMLVVLFAGMFSLLMGIYGSYMGDMALDGTQNVAYALGGALIVSGASVVVLLQLPSIASGLAGGASLSYMHELRAMRNAGAAAGRGMRGSYNGGKQVVGKAASAASSAAQKAAGYFKGGARKAA